MTESVDLHGVEVKIDSDRPQGMSVRSNDIICLYARGGPSGEDKKFIRVNNLAEAAKIFVRKKKEEAKEDWESVLMKSLHAIFFQAEGPVMVWKKSDEEVTQTDIELSIKVFPETFSLICAPNISNNPNIANAIGKAATDFGAVAVVDVTLEVEDGKESIDVAAAIKKASNLSLQSQYITYSKVNLGKGFIGSSAAVCGHIRAVDKNEGWHVSPSNRYIQGVSEVLSPVGYDSSSRTSEANRLNIGKINPIVVDSGFKLWGNRLASNDFISVERTRTKIRRTIQQNMVRSVDKGITVNFVSSVVESTNAFIRDLRDTGKILGGSCKPGVNASLTVAAGKTRFEYEFTPIFPAEHIVFNEDITLERLNAIFGNE